MKRIVIIGMFGLAFLSTGCTKTPAPTYIEKANSIPKLNTVSTREVGENLYLKQGNMSYYVELTTPPEELKSTSFNPWWLLAGPAGLGVMLLTSDSNEDKLKSLTLRSWKNTNWNMICNEDNDCLVDKNNDNHFTHSGNYPDGELNKLEKSIAYVKKSIIHPDSFKYVALYQGKVGNKIKVSYREFIENMARPSFTQDIEYDLKPNELTTIGFKGLRIDVIEATNLQVKYKVTKDYK